MTEPTAQKSQKPTVLLTGATGFVGSNLTRRLVKEGWNVHILIRASSGLPVASEISKCTKHLHDGTTQSIVNCLRKIEPDVVFHLASLFLSHHEIKDIESLIQSNILFGTQLLEAMRVTGLVNIINTGTSWQHYNNEDYNPVCLYAATKQAFESILEFYIQAFGFKVITLILFDTYGIDDPRPKLFTLLYNAAKTGERLNMSAGEQLIDLVHIDDVVNAYLTAAQRLLDGSVSKHEHYEVTSGQPLPLKELVQIYERVTRQTVAINWGARPYRSREVMRPWDRGQFVPGWTPNISLLQGLSCQFPESVSDNPRPLVFPCGN